MAKNNVAATFPWGGWSSRWWSSPSSRRRRFWPSLRGACTRTA